MKIILIDEKYNVDFVYFHRMFASAIEDLKEALKLAPTNRELQRLLIRLRDECKDQTTKLDGEDNNSDIESRRSNETAL